MDQDQGLPTARVTGLVVKALGDDVLIYDLETHRAHSVNGIAVAVWRRCDGTRDAARIATDLREDGTLLSVTEETVQYALGELGRARLLTGPVTRAPAGMTRRQVMRRLGVAAAMALPMVTTIVTPTAAQIQSCVNNGDACTNDAQCCGSGCTGTGNNGCACVGNPKTCHVP